MLVMLLECLPGDISSLASTFVWPDLRRRGLRYQGPEVKQNPKDKQESANSHESHKGEWMVPYQAQGFYQERNHDQDACNP